MRPRRTPDCNAVFHLPGGNEDSDLWALAMVLPDGSPMIRSTWELTPSERQQIADGANIELSIFTAGQPPVNLAVTHAELGAHPKGL
jgi:hypothetical protein